MHPCLISIVQNSQGITDFRDEQTRPIRLKKLYKTIDSYSRNHGFFFLMQMVWKYIDDLAGKGIEWYTILELMFYWAASVVPFALPVSVLFASLLTFGNFGEHYEMAAMKSSGISLFRGIRSLIVLNILIAVGAFFFYNNVIPVANLKGQSLLVNISKSKPAFHITPGIFYNGFEGYSIKIGEKEGDEEQLLRDIYIYDHKENKKEIIKYLQPLQASCEPLVVAGT